MTAPVGVGGDAEPKEGDRRRARHRSDRRGDRLPRGRLGQGLRAHRRLHRGLSAEGVNPRFLLAMARVARGSDRRSNRVNGAKRGVENFRLVADGGDLLSRLQLDDAELARLGQQVTARLENGSTVAPGERPNPCSTPAATCSRRRTWRSPRSTSWTRSASPTKSWADRPIAAAWIQLRTGDTEVSGRVATNSLDRLAEGKTRSHFLVRELPRAVHRDDAADHREGARDTAVRDDAVLCS